MAAAAENHISCSNTSAKRKASFRSGTWAKRALTVPERTRALIRGDQDARAVAPCGGTRP